MSLQLRAFRPLAPSQNIAVTAAAQNLTLNNVVGTAFAVRLVNKGTQDVFFTVDGTTATTAIGHILPAGQTEVFTMTNQYPISVIAAGTGSTLYATIGEGV